LLDHGAKGDTLLQYINGCSDDRIPIPISALDNAVDVACDPAAVEGAGLGHYLLAIDIAVPRTCVERQVVLYSREMLRRPLIRPDAVGDGLTGDRMLDGMVRGGPLPLTVRGPGRLR